MATLVEYAVRTALALARWWVGRYDATVSGGVNRASAALLDALARARKLIGEPDTDAPAMITGSSVPGSRAPWNARAAYAVFAVAEGARTLELDLSPRQTPRGGSDTNTDDAIVALGAIADTANGRDANAVHRQLGSWTTQLLRLPAIDEATAWAPIRLSTRCGRDGSVLDDRHVCPVCGWQARPPICPYCRTANLRLAERSFVVMCFYPGCKDRDGNMPPFARLDVSTIDARAILAWSDGLVEGGDQ